MPTCDCQILYREPNRTERRKKKLPIGTVIALHADACPFGTMNWGGQPGYAAGRHLKGKSLNVKEEDE